MHDLPQIDPLVLTQTLVGFVLFLQLQHQQNRFVHFLQIQLQLPLQNILKIVLLALLLPLLLVRADDLAQGTTGDFELRVVLQQLAENAALRL